ncbi:V-type proton ATPase subunit S1-like [Eurosta solidaginis]|uniref:V-type proton ATPase subunit S1-like n=1 Tax=Eurosta solidaginis TaxID=178769 RepID=UPI0035317B6A
MSIHFITSIVLSMCSPLSMVYSTPVFLWQATVNEKPVFPQITKDEFVTEIKPLVDSKMVVAFTYPKLLIKDFQCESCFPYLSQQTPSFTYAYVETPAMVLRSFNKSQELSVDAEGKLVTPIKCETDKLYIISLKLLSASSNPMKSCDDAIKAITTNLACPDAAYMLMGTIDVSKKIEPPGQLCQSKNLTVYISQLELHDSDGVQIYKIKDMLVQEEKNKTLTVALPTNDENATLTFTLHLKNNYLEIKYFQFKNKNFRVVDLYAPQTNSYSCGKIVLTKDGLKLVFKKFQIQYGKPQEGTHFHFYDAWTCEGFATPAIISGVFVTIIFVGILSFGINMLFNVHTPSKFDSAEGPYITINASG